MTLSEANDLNNFISNYPFLYIIDRSKDIDILRLEISEYDIYFDFLCEKSSILNYISCIRDFIQDLLDNIESYVPNIKNIKKIRRKLKSFMYLYAFREDLKDFLVISTLKYSDDFIVYDSNIQ